ncbi:MAG TPA: MFS transporter [Acidobacteriota bacterium]|nr:MFS transporter [Acidobacteriota bacterium]
MLQGEEWLRHQWYALAMRRVMVLLSAFWFLQLGTKGLFLPYFSLYLDQVGLRAGQVGWILSMLALAGLLSQPLWGVLADRTGLRRGLLAFCCLGAAACSLLLGRMEGFAAILMATVLLSTFERQLVPMSFAVSLGALSGAGRDSFGEVRVWGTVGVLVVAGSFPWIEPALARWWTDPGSPALGAMFPWAAVLFAAAAVLAFLLPSVGALSLRSLPGDIRKLLRHRPVVRALVLLFLVHLCVQGPVYLLPLLVKAKGGGTTDVSLMWVLSLSLEVPLVLRFGRLLERFNPRGLLILGALSEGLRWTLSAWIESLPLLIAVQGLHGIGVVGILLGGPVYVESAAPQRLRSTGQAWAAMAGTGAGTIASNALTGQLIENFGTRFTYMAAGAGALTVCLLFARLLPPPSRPD